MDYFTFLIELLVCFLLSLLIGFERQVRRHSVGFRTIILVSIGSFLFVTFQKSFPGSDMNRIAAQVVAGIGFLGAGVIIKDNKGVKGLTTAATLWCSSAVGVLCAANLLFEASVGTVVILFINIILRPLNNKINKLSKEDNYDIYHFKIECENNKEDEILKIISEFANKTNTKILTTELIDETETSTSLEFSIANIAKINDLTNRIMQKMSRKEEVKSISLIKKDTKATFDEEEY